MKIDFNKEWRYCSKNSQWKEISIPHDAMLAEERSAKAPGKSATGFFPGGYYTYEKEFLVTREELMNVILFEFEGAYKHAKVFINENKAGENAYGYLPFIVSTDGCLVEGKNIIRVEVDNDKQPESRWYSGAGIYRPVWMHLLNQTHIKLNGIRIHTVSSEEACIEVNVVHQGGEVEIEIYEEEKQIAKEMGDKVEIKIPDARLWSEEDPYLYKAKVILTENGRVIEVREENFGIRTITWGKDGLFVNGAETLLRGGCIHHDNGILGACEFQQSADRKIRILKENGFNAIRSAHNPCSKAILHACDKYGIYVIDETWDMWYRKKNPYDYANEFEKNYKKDLVAIVEKDYNHPCVLMYSIANEVSEPAEEKGIQLAKEMTELLHKLDAGRPVTGGFNLMIIANAAKGKRIYKEEGGMGEESTKDMSGMNSTVFNLMTSMVGSSMNKAACGKRADSVISPVLDTVDIAGYNYASGRYKEDGVLHPNRPIFGSETFPQELSKNWAMVLKYPHLIGDFMWTAWDYLGETGIGAWTYAKDAKGFAKPYPWLLADTGAFDILGNPTGEALWAKSVWKQENKPYIAVRPINHSGGKLIKAAWRGTNAIPSWSWSGCRGDKTIVEVYTKAPVVELRIDGKKAARKRTKENRAMFHIKYQPGKLEAIAFASDGEEIGRSYLQSAEENVTVSMKIDMQDYYSEKDTEDIIYIDVNITDASGIVESNQDRTIQLEISGGEILGFGSANPRTEERYDMKRYTTYYGHAQAVVRLDKSDTAQITATDDEGNKSYLEIKSK